MAINTLEMHPWNNELDLTQFLLQKQKRLTIHIDISYEIAWS